MAHIFRINKLGGKPYRVKLDGCTLSLNFRTNSEALSFVVRRDRYAADGDEYLAAKMNGAGTVERDSIRMELRARSDLRKYAEGSGKPTT